MVTADGKTTVNSERGMERLLLELLRSVGYGDEPDTEELQGCRVEDMSGYLTRDRGVVITLANGAKFQVTIKQEERAGEDAEEATESCPVCGDDGDFDGDYCGNCGYSDHRR